MADYSICTDAEISCPRGTITHDIKWGGHNSIHHSRHSLQEITVAGTKIIRQQIDREFTIEYREQATWTGEARFSAMSYDPYFCGETTYSGSGASISEDITILDTDILYLDHINGLMFWREVEQRCHFYHPADKQALFRTAWGSFWAWWMEVKPTRSSITKWKLLINGEVETLKTVTAAPVTATTPQYNVLYPLPPSAATPVPDRAPESFYDYFTDEALAQADGGQDWYYPDWMRDTMGINRGELVEDATTRYEWWYNSKRPMAPTETFTAPILPTAYPYGNLARDAAGNVLVSFTTGDSFVNKLYLADGTTVDLNTIDPAILEGDQLKLYPVGIV